MAISFNGIPDDLEVPGQFVEVDNAKAVSGSPPLPNRVILIGNRTTPGSAAEGELKQILREEDGITFFGARSQLGWMCEKFKKAAKFVEVWAVALDDDGAGVANTRTITVTGTATSSGILRLLVHGIRVSVAVASGDDPTAIATAVVAALTAEPRIMFAASNVAGVITLTCVHAAEFGNDLDVRANYYPREELDNPDSVSLAIVNNDDGAGNPDASVAVAAIGDEFFSSWVLGYSDAANVLVVETELADRWSPTVQQPGVAFYGLVGTHAAITAIGDARNSQFSVMVGAGESPAPPWEVAAVAAAISAAEPDPARPRQTLALPNILPPAREDRFTLSERNLLLKSGIATLKVDDGGRVLIERLVTTYKTNSSSLPDKSFQDLTTMLTLAAMRFTLRARISQKYPRHKLVSDGTDYGTGQAVVTPSVVRGEILSLFEEWEDSAWAENYEQFAEELIVERNASNRNRVDVRMGPDIANQFRLFAAQIQFQL